MYLCSLNCSFSITVLTPSMFLTHWAFLSLLIFSSWMRALSLFYAICLFPTPAWWILPRRHSTWALIAANDSLLLICPTISAFSWSLPPSGLPSASTGSWAWTQPWFLSSHGHPDLPLISPNSSNLCLSGPFWPDGVFMISWSRSTRCVPWWAAW